MILQVYIDGVAMDVDSKSTKIATTKQHFDFLNPGSMKSDFVSRLSLPLTTVNKANLEQMNPLSTITAKPYRNHTVRIIQDGWEVIPAGVCQISGIKDGRIQVDVQSGIKGLATAIDGKYLNDLDFTSWNGKFWPAGQDAFRNVTSGVVAPITHNAAGGLTALTDLGGIAIETYSHAPSVMPWVYYKSLVDQIFTLAGYKKVGAIFKDAKRYLSMAISLGYTYNDWFLNQYQYYAYAKTTNIAIAALNFQGVWDFNKPNQTTNLPADANNCFQGTNHDYGIISYASSVPALSLYQFIRARFTISGNASGPLTLRIQQFTRLSFVTLYSGVVNGLFSITVDYQMGATDFISHDFTNGTGVAQTVTDQKVTDFAINTSDQDPVQWPKPSYVVSGPGSMTMSMENWYMKATKTVATGAYDSQVYSTYGWVQYAFVSFRWAAGAFIMGFNSDPLTNALRASIDYGFDVMAGVQVDCVESNVIVAANVLGRAPLVTDLFEIIYDGTNVIYLINHTVVRTVGRALGFTPLYLDSSFNSINSQAVEVIFYGSDFWWVFNQLLPRYTLSLFLNDFMQMFGLVLRENGNQEVEFVFLEDIIQNRVPLQFQYTLGGAGTIAKTEGAGFLKSAGAVAYDTQVYSNSGFTQTAYIRFFWVSGTLAVGLNSDPTTDATLATIDYCFRPTATQVDIVESNVTVAANVLARAPLATDVFEIVYDGTNVVYKINGTVMRTIARGVGVALFLDSSFNTLPSEVAALVFSSGQQGTTAEITKENTQKNPEYSYVPTGWGKSNYFNFNILALDFPLDDSYGRGLMTIDNDVLPAIVQRYTSLWAGSDTASAVKINKSAKIPFYSPYNGAQSGLFLFATQISWRLALLRPGVTITNEYQATAARSDYFHAYMIDKTQLASIDWAEFLTDYYASYAAALKRYVAMDQEYYISSAEYAGANLLVLKNKYGESFILESIDSFVPGQFTKMHLIKI